MRFVGIDQSLTACGLCVLDEEGGVLHVETIRPGNLQGMERVRAISDVIVRRAAEAPSVAILEGAAFRGIGARDLLVELAAVIKWRLWEVGVPVCDYAPPPATLVKYHTGDGGGATKDRKKRMLETARRAGAKLLDDHHADAWGLARLLWDAWRGVEGRTLHQAQTLARVRAGLWDQLKGAIASGRRA